MPNMVMTMLDGLLLGVHNANTPTDAEWTEYLNVCAEMLRRQEEDGVPCRQLIVTDGGGPSLDQRRAARRVTHSRGGRVSVVSRSAFVRFAVKALTLTNPAIRVFSPERMGEALAYLGVANAATIEPLIAAARARLTWPKAPPKDAKKRRGNIHTS